jgi:uncharacterized protein DUF3563
VLARAAAENGGMKNLVQQIFAALERGAQRLREREIESYLSEATDAADLENRLRRLERASLRRQLLQVAE